VERLSLMTVSACTQTSTKDKDSRLIVISVCCLTNFYDSNDFNIQRRLVNDRFLYVCLWSEQEQLEESVLKHAIATTTNNRK